jgi:hypothetical protein
MERKSLRDFKSKVEYSRYLRGLRSKTDQLNTPLSEPASPIVTSIGATPFIRENDVNFAARNLKPVNEVNVFFDEIKVNDFTQRASVINVANSVALSLIKVNEGIYGSTSRAYAEILGSSKTATSNVLYLNENFVTIRITNDGGFVLAGDFKKGDLVYQTATNTEFDFNQFTGQVTPSYTFLGKVKYWEYSNISTGYLVIEPIYGRMNLSQHGAATSTRLWNLTTPFAPSVFKVVQNTLANTRFSAGEPLRYASNGATYIPEGISTTQPYISLSSIVTAVNTSNVRSIVLSSNNITRDGIGTIVGNTITIVSGSNMGFRANVVGVTTNTAYGWTEAVVDADLPESLTSNSVYSIGKHTVNDVGSIFGIFHIPSENNLRWPTGERLFTITDTATYNDNAYKMRATGKYNALGKMNTVENARNMVLREQTPSTLQAAPKVTQETQKINDRKSMAQTFFTPRSNQVVNNEVKTTYGILTTSIDLYFRSKPTNSEELLPFTVALCKVDSGFPSNDIIAECTLDAMDINVSPFPPNYANTAAMTKFRFKDPVPLLPATEYAIKLMTDSPDYQVWTAELGEIYTDENGNDRLISDQPNIGNLYRAQNASIWTPILNEDLMFNLNRAAYNPTRTLYFNIVPDEDTAQNILMDEVQIFSEELQYPPTSITYEIKAPITDGTDPIGYVKVNNKETYKYGKDTDISSASSKRRRLIPKGNTAAVNVRVTMTTTDNTVAPVLNTERLSLFAVQNIINNAGIANNLITITNPGAGHSNAANIVVSISNPDVGSDVATANVLPSMLSGGKVMGINIINPGAGYFTSPRITISESGAATNAKAVINGETDASGGNILAKYQTKVVTLEDGFESGDLVVKMDAIKPSGTEVAVYFKVLSALDSDPFDLKKWKRMTPIATNTSKDQFTSVPLEFRFNLSKGQIEYFEGNKAYPLGGKFKYFAIKIRLTAQDPTVVPMVDNLKVIAVPGETPISTVTDAGFYA